MTKMEPTEAQRKAMLDALKGRTGTWSTAQMRQRALDEMITAANSIPEGPPVGTIARRPDGKCLALRAEGEEPGTTYWKHFPFVCGPEGFSHRDDTDSWPVIYDPTKGVPEIPPPGFFPGELPDPDEYHEGDKPRLERLMREPSVFDGDADEVEELAKWLSVHIGTWPEDEWELRSKPNYYHDRAKELLDFGYRKVSDPTAQQEPEAFNRFPGIENVTAADRIGAENADAQLRLVFKLRDIRIERCMEISDVAAAMEVSAAEVARFESGSTNPRMSMIRRYARAIEAVFTVDVRKWEDTPAQEEPQSRFAESQHAEYVRAKAEFDTIPRGSVMRRGIRMSDWLATDYRRLSDPGPSVPDSYWVDDEYDEWGNPR